MPEASELSRNLLGKVKEKVIQLMGWKLVIIIMDTKIHKGSSTLLYAVTLKKTRAKSPFLEPYFSKQERGNNKDRSLSARTAKESRKPKVPLCYFLHLESQLRKCILMFKTVSTATK